MTALLEAYTLLTVQAAAAPVHFTGRLFNDVPERQLLRVILRTEGTCGANAFAAFSGWVEIFGRVEIDFAFPMPPCDIGVTITAERYSTSLMRYVVESTYGPHTVSLAEAEPGPEPPPAPPPTGEAHLAFGDWFNVPGSAEAGVQLTLSGTIRNTGAVTGQLKVILSPSTSPADSFTYYLSPEMAPDEARDFALVWPMPNYDLVVWLIGQHYSPSQGQYVTDATAGPYQIYLGAPPVLAPLPPRPGPVDPGVGPFTLTGKFITTLLALAGGEIILDCISFLSKPGNIVENTTDWLKDSYVALGGDLGRLQEVVENHAKTVELAERIFGSPGTWGPIVDLYEDYMADDRSWYGQAAEALQAGLNPLGFAIDSLQNAVRDETDWLHGLSEWLYTHPPFSWALTAIEALEFTVGAMKAMMDMMPGGPQKFFESPWGYFLDFAENVGDALTDWALEEVD